MQEGETKSWAPRGKSKLCSSLLWVRSLRGRLGVQKILCLVRGISSTEYDRGEVTLTAQPSYVGRNE